MNDQHAAEILARHNEWRRYRGETGAEGAPVMGDPTEIGLAIDHVVKRILEAPATTAAHGWVRIPKALAERVLDALGRFTSDEGWGMEDMETGDELAGAIVNQPATVDIGQFRPAVATHHLAARKRVRDCRAGLLPAANLPIYERELADAHRLLDLVDAADVQQQEAGSDG